MNVNPKIIEDLNNTVKTIESGEFSLNDIKQLLVDLRFIGSPMLDDLANFVTHKAGRNRGKTYETVRKYVTSTLDQMENGMLVGSQPDPVYERQEIIDEIVRSLVKLGTHIQVMSFNKQADKILEGIEGIITRVPLEIEDSRVLQCWLEKENGKVILNFEMDHNFKNLIIKVAEGGTILIKTPLF